MDIDFYFYIIAAALIAGIVRYRSIQPAVLRLLLPFLAFTLIMEVIGKITVKMHVQNHWIFNFFTCCEFLFYSYIYSKLLADPKWVRVVRYGMIAYPVLFVANISFGEGFNHFHTITYRVGSVMIVIWCYLYFRQIMRSEAFESVLRVPAFWISTGLLFFYTGFFFYMSAAYILMYTKLVIDKIVWYAISGTLNAILYGSFLIAFLCPVSPKKK
ncbi:MAG TPA: hypothetical protein VMH27_04915 [Puia sp.]|nr:hypothetical protein [Puia sp.]